MFNDPNEEEILCQILKAYVEEWGAENVTVSVPKNWISYNRNSLGKVKLEFVTDKTVEIKVEYDFVRINYCADIIAA